MKTKFPLQAKFIGYASTLVVSFTDEHKGTVVTGDEVHEAGEYSEHWTSCLSHNLWEVIKP